MQVRHGKGSDVIAGIIHDIKGLFLPALPKRGQIPGNHHDNIEPETQKRGKDQREIPGVTAKTGDHSGRKSDVEDQLHHDPVVFLTKYPRPFQGVCTQNDR